VVAFDVACRLEFSWLFCDDETANAAGNDHTGIAEPRFL
jgi:hypothetical protein